MKLGKLLITGLFLAGSASASAGEEIFLSVHDIQSLTMKSASVNEKGKITKDTIKRKDVGELLCGRELTKNEKLVAYIPCPAEDFLDYGGFYIGVFDEELKKQSADCNMEDFDIFNAIIESDKKDATRISKIESPMDGELNQGGVSIINPVEINVYATGIVDFEVINDKKGKLGPMADGADCAKKGKTKSLLGYDDSGDDEFVIEKGEMQVGKVKWTGLASQIFD